MGLNYGIMIRIEKNMNKISVAYHKAIKFVLNMNTWDSNHLTCEILGGNLYRHLQAKRMYMIITDLY